MTDIYLEELKNQDYHGILSEVAPVVPPAPPTGTAVSTPGAAPGTPPPATPPPATPPAETAPPAATPPAATTPESVDPTNARQRLVKVIQDYFNVTLPDETATYISKDPKNRLIKHMIAVDPDIGMTYDPAAVKLATGDNPTQREETPLVNVQDAPAVPVSERHIPSQWILLESATEETVQAFLKAIGAPPADPASLAKAIVNWEAFIDAVKYVLKWDYDIKFEKDTGKLKEALLAPALEYDPNKRYYLNVAGKDMKRTFNWKNLKDGDINATYKNPQNALKAQQALQDYVIEIVASIPEAYNLNPALGDFDSLYEQVCETMILNEQISIPADLNLGKPGEVPTKLIIEHILGFSVGADAVATTKGFGPDDVLGKILFTDKLFKSIKPQMEPLLNKYFADKKSGQIPLAPPRGKPPITLVVGEELNKTLINYILKVVAAAETRRDLDFKTDLMEYAVACDDKDKAAAGAFVKAMSEESRVNDAVHEFNAIIDAAARGGGLLRIDVPAMNVLHKFINDHFIADPNMYILYLTADQWTDIGLGGTAMGGMTGLVSGLANAFGG